MNRRGFFDADVLVATILAALILSISVYSTTSFAKGFTEERALAEKEREAMRHADWILKKCVDEGGLAACDGDAILSHVIENTEGTWQLGNLKPGNGVCVNRLAITRGGEERVIRACAE